MVLPVLSTIIGGLLMMTLIGKPIAWLQEALIHLLESMQGGSRFLMGAILGAMATFDFGGPVNKTMSLFSDGLLVSGVYGPEAVKFVGSIIPPFGITLSFLLTRHKYTRAEREALKAAFPMGICMITEGVIPIAARDLLRVVGSCVVASAVAGGLIMVWGVAISIFNLSYQSRIIKLSPENTDIAMAIFSAIYNVGIGSGAYIGGLISSKAGLSNIGLIGFAFVAVAFMYGLLYVKPLLLKGIKKEDGEKKYAN